MNIALATAAIAASLACTATMAHASEADSVKQTVRTWFAKFNAGDGAGALALNTENGSIIDEFAPFRWTRFADWFKDYDAYAQTNGITASKIRIGNFTHVNVDGGRAYVVVPATYVFRENGRPHSEPATDVLSLEKINGSWRITSAAWLGRTGVDTGADATAVTNTVAAFASMASPPSPPPVAIVDEFAPYHWEGANANADWFAGLTRLNAADGVTDMALKLSAPSQLAVNGDWAYAAFPTVIASKHHGKSEAEHGGFAFTLHRQNGGWQIVSWAWGTK